ncbi:Cytochrome P450 [Tessaracoccus bendigoensis DSM 12906]|uniref:Cytochrome P450 n=1 Tax=Tessaracoccus bendigoensis DSM 12906 TaxID=1123357 RepID=A0A1M6J8Q2_9ACTN|nr:cytochrome P450 [Tessaracoccus bendigoensis]SHJ43085.1 Cytochrome P450 [Tessaracoccus bendigoensis DSM 12906]
MTETRPDDIDPHAEAGTQPDLRVMLDAQRETCPVVRGADGSVALLGHADVRAAALDAELFSSAVSAHRALPNSLDGEEHRAYRRLIDAYLTAEEVEAQEPQCRAHAAAIVDALPRGATVRTVLDIGTPYAVRVQATWLGWPSEIEQELVDWVAENREASRSGDRQRLAAVAESFDAIITRLLEARRDGSIDDVTARLMRDKVDGVPLRHEEIVSILRNWTAGDLGSLAASVGVIVHHLATDTALQSYLRQLVAADRVQDFEDAIEEILRIDDPFVSNRRVTTRDTTIGGEEVAAGTRVVLNWTAANRDPQVFPEPDAFNPVHHADANLVFGIGPHICPGRALTLMELRVLVWELLAGTGEIGMSEERGPVRELPPVSGWAKVPIVLDPR